MYNKVNSSEEPWVLIESYLESISKQLIRHQLESYNYFVNTQIENTIEMFNPVHICSDQIILKN